MPAAARPWNALAPGRPRAVTHGLGVRAEELADERRVDRSEVGRVHDVSTIELLERGVLAVQPTASGCMHAQPSSWQIKPAAHQVCGQQLRAFQTADAAKTLFDYPHAFVELLRYTTDIISVATWAL